MALIIPTTFTARGNYAQTVSAYRRETVGFQKDLRGLSNTARNVFSSGGLFGQLAGVGAAALTAKGITDYEDAVASFRTIVSDLNDADFSEFKKEIATVAFDTKRSSVLVAQSFEKIAGLNASFAETAGGLGQVATAAITLSKAARMDLAPASENLVGIMNQFSYRADQAAKTINVLAAGQAVGAASISQTADALTNFGSTAAGANVTLEQTVGLIQTMAKYGQLGADAGHRLRSALIKIQETGAGYASGKFQIDDALVEVKKRFDELPTAIAKDAYLTKVFGLEQITTGRILMSNIDIYKEFTKQVTGTAEAEKAAGINSNTLSNRLGELRDKWTTITTTSAGAGIGLAAITGAVLFLTNNMEGLLSVATPLISAFAIWKGLIYANTVRVWLLTKSMTALNFVEGIATVINGKYATSCFATEAGMNGMIAASWVLETSLLSLSLITGGVIAAIGLLAFGFKNGYDENVNYNKELEKTKNGFVELASPITAAQVALDEYNKAMREYNKLKTFEAYLQYERSKGGANAVMSDIYNALRHPILSSRAAAEENSKNKNLLMPNKADFFMNPADSAMNFESGAADSSKVMPYGGKPMSKSEVNHHFTIDLKNNGKSIGTYSSIDMIPSTTSTMGYS